MQTFATLLANNSQHCPFVRSFRLFRCIYYLASTNHPAKPFAHCSLHKKRDVSLLFWFCFVEPPTNQIIICCKTISSARATIQRTCDWQAKLYSACTALRNFLCFIDITWSSQVYHSCRYSQRWCQQFYASIWVRTRRGNFWTTFVNFFSVDCCKSTLIIFTICIQ